MTGIVSDTQFPIIPNLQMASTTGRWKPPLPDLTRHVDSTNKHNEPETLHERSLQQFAVIINDELNDLHTRFLHEVPRATLHDCCEHAT